MQGLQGYQGSLAANQEAALRAAQLEGIQSQAQLRDMQADAARRKQDNIARFLGMPQSSQGALEQAAGMGIVGPRKEAAALMNNPMGTGSLNMSGGSVQVPEGMRSAVAADLMFNDGKKISEFIRPNIDFVSGVAVNKNDLRPGFSLPQLSQDGKASQLVPDPTAPGGFRVVAPSGSVDTFGAYQNAGEQAKARYDLVQVQNRDGTTSYVPRLSLAQGVTQPGTQPLPANTSFGGSLGSDPVKRDAVIGDLNRSNGGAMGFGQTTSDKASAAALGDLNKDWVEKSYRPALDADRDASNVINSVKNARRAMSNMGATGWGTETKAAAANVLSSLGIAPDSVSQYASNAQLFQQAAMDRLFVTLAAQKGPQTEGDANRASQIFGRLQNTPQANAFILDFMEAQAEMDRRKAQFYTNAMPRARASGDLTEVDRAWNSRNFGLFDMPSMKRWKQ
ncbi:hypothetical protein IP84_17065 [beta proteobacterium AAP99]|nr:hypothetical protein IP84_17065 [beta proteobacterium AAP99]